MQASPVKQPIMWASTVGLVNGKHRYLTAETFGFKINSNGQVMKKRQQWTIEPFPESLLAEGAAVNLVSSPCPTGGPQQQQSPLDPNDPCILTFSSAVGASLTSIKSSNGSSASDQDVCGEEHENVAIKSHLNKYLAVDSFGNVTCDSEEKTENARFTITICSMSQGRSKDEHIFWAFRNVERGYYLGTTEDGMICCNAKMPKSRAELWHLHLIPARGASFFALKSLGRKRFARVVDEDTRSEYLRQSEQDSSKLQVQLDATISWGPETLFQFKYYEGGRYALLSSNCLYLTNEGKCISWKAVDELSMPPPECLFTLEYHSGFLAFRDSFGQYLAAAGRSSVLRSRSIGVTRDELFVFESAPIQVSLKATFNNRYVSIKQCIDVSANQTEASNRFETFQLTYHKQTQNWSIMTHDCNFWTVVSNTNTIGVCKPADYEALTRGQFKLIWSETDATCSLKYIDADGQGRFVSARKSGQLFAGSGPQPPVKFIMRFQNRRLLNLRPVNGSAFVGLKGASTRQVEANKTSPDSIAIEYSEPPVCSGLDVRQRAVPPAVGPKPSAEAEQQSINLFNVKLNSTKMGLERFNYCNKAQSVDTFTAPSEAKQIDECYVVDDNNNFSAAEESEPAAGNAVESSSTPSVASIISSFSNAKLSARGQANGQVTSARQTSTQSPKSDRANSSVFKLASSFDAGKQQLSDAGSDTASVITSCSAASAQSAASIQTDVYQTNATTDARGPDQLAQAECCYLKVISTESYLVVGNDSSVLCDATNKACAQSWILELRSHNSVAIRASDNHAYMQLGTNGTISIARCDPAEASLWEF